MSNPARDTIIIKIYKKYLGYNVKFSIASLTVSVESLQNKGVVDDWYIMEPKKSGFNKCIRIHLIMNFIQSGEQPFGFYHKIKQKMEEFFSNFMIFQHFKRRRKTLILFGICSIIFFIFSRLTENQENYYTILQIPKTASQSAIKKDYITAVKKYHPDIVSDLKKNFNLKKK